MYRVYLLHRSFFVFVFQLDETKIIEPRNFDEKQNVNSWNLSVDVATERVRDT